MDTPANAVRPREINYHPLCGWFEDTPLEGGTCNDLITSDALLDYITGFSLN
jgi:hypothetical protein